MSPRVDQRGQGRMAEQSYDPIVPMKVGNHRAPKGRPWNPLEGRGKQAHASVERRHNRDSEPGSLCAQTSTEYLHSPKHIPGRGRGGALEEPAAVIVHGGVHEGGVLAEPWWT